MREREGRSMCVYFCVGLKVVATWSQVTAIATALASGDLS